MVRSDSSSMASTSYDPDHAELPGAKDRRAVSQIKLICIDMDGESICNPDSYFSLQGSRFQLAEGRLKRPAVDDCRSECEGLVAVRLVNADAQDVGFGMAVRWFCPPDFSLILCAGTLLDSQSKILPSSVTAIKAALDQGVLVCLATGKARPAAISALQSVGLAGAATAQDLNMALSGMQRGGAAPLGLPCASHALARCRQGSCG